MKNLIIFTLVLLLGSECFAQIRPHKKGGYSLEEVKSFVQDGTLLSLNWRIKLADLINTGLVKAGEKIVLKETKKQTNINWIAKHVVYRRIKLISFLNSDKDKITGNQIIFIPDANYDGEVAVFCYGECELIIFKTECMNLLDDVVFEKIDPLKQVEPEPVVENNNSNNNQNNNGNNNNLQPPPKPQNNNHVKVMGHTIVRRVYFGMF